MDRLEEKFKRAYTPGREIALDEVNDWVQGTLGISAVHAQKKTQNGG